MANFHDGGQNYAGSGSQLDWLLDDLVNRVPDVQRTVFLSQDGLALGASRGLQRDDAEHLAALSAGFQSLARGAGRHFGGGEVRQTIIEMVDGFLFVMAAGQGTCLAVLTSAEPDVGQVAYEMAILVQRTGEHMQVNMRTPSLCVIGEVVLDAESRPAMARSTSWTRRPAVCTHTRTHATLR